MFAIVSMFLSELLPADKVLFVLFALFLSRVEVARRWGVIRIHGAGGPATSPSRIAVLVSFVSMIDRQVERIVLVDRQWPLNTKGSVPGPNHINWDHIYHPGWSIPLRSRKNNIKSGREQRQLAKHVFGRSSGPVVLCAVHLCGTLAVKAVQIFNENENIALFHLKFVAVVSWLVVC